MFKSFSSLLPVTITVENYFSWRKISENVLRQQTGELRKRKNMKKSQSDETHRKFKNIIRQFNWTQSNRRLNCWTFTHVAWVFYAAHFQSNKHLTGLHHRQWAMETVTMLIMPSKIFKFSSANSSDARLRCSESIKCCLTMPISFSPKS